MYSRLPAFILGFHGCDKKIANSILAGEINHLKNSSNDFDWLGHGIYFWENNPERALEFAQEQKNRKNSNIKEPAVIGAVINLGHCCNLLDKRYLQQVTSAYDYLLNLKKMGYTIPENKNAAGNGDLLLRHLDCAVIEAMHYQVELSGIGFDSVRGGFFEGIELYPNSGFKSKNHIQICVRNPNCIKGYFRPLQSDPKFRIP